MLFWVFQVLPGNPLDDVCTTCALWCFYLFLRQSSTGSVIVLCLPLCIAPLSTAYQNHFVLCPHQNSKPTPSGCESFDLKLSCSSLYGSIIEPYSMFSLLRFLLCLVGSFLLSFYKCGWLKSFELNIQIISLPSTLVCKCVPTGLITISKWRN